MSNVEHLVDRRNPLRALLVDADDGQRQCIEAELVRRGLQTIAVSSFAAARASLHADLSLLVVSGALPGAGAVPQLVRAARRISPLVECAVVRDCGDNVGRMPAVREVLRPFSPTAFDECVQVADETRTAMRAVTTLLVGRIGLKEAQRVLRAGMSQAALARCAGSRRAAAALLGVDRRYVQKLCAERQTGVAIAERGFTQAANGTTGY